MIKYKLFILIIISCIVIPLSGCSKSTTTECPIDQELIDGRCQIITFEPPTCDDGYSPFENKCVNDSNLNPFERTYTLEEVTQDFDQIISVLNLYNPLLFGNKDDIDEFVDQQRQLLYDNMTIYEFYRITSPIAMAYKCGHTVLNLDYDVYRFTYDNALFFPLDVRIINNQIVVIGRNEAYGIPNGSVITKINGRYTNNILEELLAYVPADGDSVNGRYAKLNQRFAMTYYYLYPSETFELTYKEPNSTITHSITINAEKMDTITANASIEQEELLPFKSEIKESYAILTIKSFSAYGSYTNNDFYDFFNEFFTTIETNDIQHVIIDIRQNWGGDPLIASDLFSYIASYSQQYFSDDSPTYYSTLSSEVPLSEPHYNGNLYILIDGITFSTAGHFAALVKSQNIGVFIGSETSGSFAVADSHIEVRLNNTNLQLYTSREIWKVDVDNLPIGRGIIPDYPVYPSWEDYVNNIDRVMQFTLDLINSNL